MNRFFELFIVSILGTLLLIPAILLIVLIKFDSKGPVLHFSKRIGKDNCLFLMPKFRSMKMDTPQVATHLLTNVTEYQTKVGRLIRNTSLDEIPQIVSVLKGDMCLVGPRPALFNQDDLIALRTQKKIHMLKPGITGWAQVNGRDNLSIQEKVEMDVVYSEKRSFTFDVYILLLTLKKVVSRKDISH